MTAENRLNKEKATFGLLCFLPFLAFLSIGFYSHSVISRALLVLESGVFFLLLVFNLKKRRNLLLLAINCASVAVTIFYHSGVGVALAFFNLLVAILIFNRIALERREKQILHFISSALLLLLCLSANFGEVTIKDFLGRALNPNVVGMLLLSLLLHTYIYISGLDVNRKKRLVFLSLTILVFGYLIYLTACRSAMISLAVFLLFLLLGRIYKRDIPYFVYKFFSVGILILSLLFTFAYVILSEKLEGIEVLGKSLFTGRETVWQSAFGLISESAIFGNGTDFLLDTVGGNKTASAHNTLLSIWYTLGVIPTATVTFFFVNGGDGEAKRDRVTQFALLSSLFICFFESFYADPTIALFFLPFLLSKVKKE